MRKSTACLLMLTAVLATAACDRVDRYPGYEAFAPFRQSSQQEIPGTWGTRLEPLPSRYDPKLTPAEVLDRFAADTPRDMIVLDLARYRDTLGYVIDQTPLPPTDSPAWVLLTRGACFNSEKGALVASSRRPDSYNPTRCSLANISILAINADTGALLATARGYDDTLEWTPERQGNPTNPAVGSVTPVASVTPVVSGTPVATP
jgi:hypothetical protein